MMDRGLDTGHWRMYEPKLKSDGVHLVLGTDSPSVAALKKVGWRPFSGMGQAIFSFLVQKPEG